VSKISVPKGGRECKEGCKGEGKGLEERSRKFKITQGIIPANLTVYRKYNSSTLN
jgi:hypothetical protein